MAEKSTFALIRWGVPGWTMAIAFVSLVFLDYLSANDTRMFELLNTFFSSCNSVQALSIGVLFTAAGIPIGYIIYQIYYYLRWNSPYSTNGLFPPLIHGRHAEISDVTRGIEIELLSGGHSWKRDLLSNTDHRKSWHLVTQLINDALLSFDKNGHILERHRSLVDILNSLGASHLGFLAGFVLYLLIKWKLGQAELWWTGIATGFLFLVVLTLASEVSQNSFIVRINRFIKHPAEVFLAFVFALFVLLNPKLSNIFPQWLLLVLFLSVFIGWAYIVREDGGSIGTMGAISFLLFAVLDSHYPVVRERANWPIVLSTISVASISVVFLRNRQNTRELLVTMEHYYLRKYFCEPVPSRSCANLPGGIEP